MGRVVEAFRFEEIESVPNNSFLFVFGNGVSENRINCDEG